MLQLTELFPWLICSGGAAWSGAMVACCGKAQRARQIRAKNCIRQSGLFSTTTTAAAACTARYRIMFNFVALLSSQAHLFIASLSFGRNGGGVDPVDPAGRDGARPSAYLGS